MRYLLFAYAALAALSAGWYAFTGLPFWSPLGPNDGARFILLAAMHLAGPFALLAALEMKND